MNDFTLTYIPDIDTLYLFIKGTKKICLTTRSATYVNSQSHKSQSAGAEAFNSKYKRKPN